MGFPVSLTGLPVPVTGAAAATRYAGGTATGAPGSGTFAVGDFVVDQTGFTWICTVAGTPGTWVSGQSSGGITNATATAISSGTGGVSGDTTIATNGAVRLAVTFAGNVGVGTTTPAYKLDVNGVLNCNDYTGHGVVNAGVVSVQPVFELYRNKDGGGIVRMWQWGEDTSNDTGNGKLDSYFFARGLQDGTNGVQDVMFVTDYTPAGPGAVPLVAFGFGYTPPPSGWRTAISAPDSSTWGALLLRTGVSTTGPFLKAVDSSGAIRFQVNNDGSVVGADNSINAQGLVVNNNGSNNSSVLTVLGRTTAAVDLVHVNLSGQAGFWAVQRDGGADVQHTLKGSGGVTNVQFRTQTLIANLKAGSAGDNILILKMAASPSAAPFIIQTSTPSTLFQIDQTGNMTLADAANVVLGTTTGTKIGTAASQKIALWNTTPNVQPTNAIVAAAFVANTSGIANDTATFGGYTIGQVVAALIRIGALA